MIQLVFARGPKGEFGLDDGFPWPHISQDLKNFKSRTKGTDLVMGAKTFSTLPGLLPGRKHIVVCDITRVPPLSKDGQRAHEYVDIRELDTFIEEISKSAFTYSVIGGANLIIAALPYASTIIASRIASTNMKEADTVLQPELIASLDICSKNRIIYDLDTDSEFLTEHIFSESEAKTVNKIYQYLKGNLSGDDLTHQDYISPGTIDMMFIVYNDLGLIQSPTFEDKICDLIKHMTEM